MQNPHTPRRRGLRFMGAKNKLEKWIRSFFPKYTVYVEPFFGSGAVFYNLNPSPVEIINDLNGNVVNFFRTLRDEPDELIRQIALTPYAKEEFEKTPIIFDVDESLSLSDVERARLFYTWSWMCFYPNTGRRKQPFRLIKGDTSGDYADLEPLYFLVDRLRGVQIMNIPAGELITKMLKGRELNLKDTLFYCDPPYVPETRSDKKGTYADEMSVSDHVAFCQLALQIPKIVISAYENSIYNDAFVGWTKVHKDTTKMARDEDGDTVRAVETLYISPGCGIYISEQYELPIDAEAGH